MTDGEASRWDALVESIGVEGVQAMVRRDGVDSVSVQLLDRVRGESSGTDAAARIRARLERLERERLEVMAERRALVERLKAEGWSWSQLEAAFGVSRPALLK